MSHELPAAVDQLKQFVARQPNDCSQPIHVVQISHPDGREPEATYLRGARQLGLFRHLPALIESIFRAGAPVVQLQPDDVAADLAALPSSLKVDVADQPGRALMNFLPLIESRPDLLSFC